MAFLKDFISYKDAIWKILLPASWVLFCLAIIATIVSFFVSQRGLSTQLNHAEKYYLENDDTYLNKKNYAAVLTDFANYSSAISFVLAIITSIAFVIVNLENGAKMSDKKSTNIAMEGASVPKMQQVTNGTQSNAIATCGAPIPTMQLAPAVPVIQKPTTTPVPSNSQSDSIYQNSSSTTNSRSN